MFSLLIVWVKTAGRGLCCYWYGAWSCFIWQHESQSLGCWRLVAVPAVREWEGGLGGHWTHESQAMKEVRVSGAELTCTESCDSFYNDASRVMSPLAIIMMSPAGVTFSIPLPPPRLLRFGLHPAWCCDTFHRCWVSVCVFPLVSRLQIKPGHKQSGVDRPCDIDLTVRVKSWALSLSSLDGAVIIVTQMSSSVMSDVVMDVWTDFWWIRALSLLNAAIIQVLGLIKSVSEPPV